MKKCPNCHTVLPDPARFCHQCGARVEEPPRNFSAPGPEDIAAHFFETLRYKVREEQDASLQEQYLQRFRESDFGRIFDIRIDQLTAAAADLADHHSQPKEAIAAFLDPALDDLSDFFIIRYCRDLHVVPIPEAVLQYQQMAPEQIDLFRFIMDYLHFESEPETVYTNLLQMPVEKLRNASQAFLFPAKQERIFFICDLSLLGSCKEGFAMTDKALYWKTPLEKARKVAFSGLEQIRREKDWLQINGLFFHASRTLDVRLMKLLRRLKKWF
ncbi:MAG: zinc ribbon domain-containing protein [Lewinellaceae bacterium]|nr:zinc ribbon domain-containing protein [Lewinellaceae bacterium]